MLWGIRESERENTAGSMFALYAKLFSRIIILGTAIAESSSENKEQKSI